MRTLRSIMLSAILLLFCMQAHAETVITRVSDKQSVSLTQLISAVELSDLTLIGEAHDHTKHHEMQLTVIRALWEKKVPFAIGLEMFEARNQQALDDWTNGKMSEESFRAIYAKMWSLDWSLYRNIFLFAREKRIPMVGLNIPKELVIKVSRKGYAALTEEERNQLPQGTNCDLNNPHTPFLESRFKKVFNKVTGSERVFAYFCEAQTLRNSGMAVNAIRYAKQYPGRKIVALAGIWHAAKNAIPDQVKRLGSKQVATVILPEIPELRRTNATPEVVDFMIGE